MQTPIAPNAHCLDQPHWRVIARGFDTERWFTDGQAIGNGGIVDPEKVDVPSGQYYYRFTCSAYALSTQLSSGWWLDFEAFQTVSNFALNNGYRLRDAVRLLLALPYAWKESKPSLIDRQVKVLLKVPLVAYGGQGKPARGLKTGPDRGSLWIPPPHLRVRQLYVPGLNEEVKAAKPSASDPPRHKPMLSKPPPRLYETVFQLPAQFTPLR